MTGWEFVARLLHMNDGLLYVGRKGSLNGLRGMLLASSSASGWRFVIAAGGKVMIPTVRKV